MGGLTNSVLRALERMGLADVFGASRVPMLVLNVVYPLVPEEIREFCAGKRAVLDRRGRQPRLHRAGGQRRAAPRRHPDQACSARGRCRRPANIPSEVLLRGPRRLPASGAAERPRRRRRRGEGARARRAQGEGRRRARPAAAAPAGLLHRLPGAAGVLGAQADAARARPDAHLGRHRLPFVRDLRAVLDGQFDPRLRHVARQRRRGRAQHGEAPDRHHGRRRLLAQRADHRRRLAICSTKATAC